MTQNLPQDLPIGSDISDRQLRGRARVEILSADEPLLVGPGREPGLPNASRPEGS